MDLELNPMAAILAIAAGIISLIVAKSSGVGILMKIIIFVVAVVVGYLVSLFIANRG